MNSARTTDQRIAVIADEHYEYISANTTRTGSTAPLRLEASQAESIAHAPPAAGHKVEPCSSVDPGNVVRVLDHGLVRTRDYVRAYIAMEYVKGRTLRSHLQQAGRMDVPRCNEIVENLALAIAAIHRVGLLHNDLKPENVVLDGNDQVKILDLGCAALTAQSLSDSVASARFGGTVRYAAPERLRSNEDVDGRSDLNSLGLVLYELMTGCHPCAAEGARPFFSGRSAPTTLSSRRRCSPCIRRERRRRPRDQSVTRYRDQDVPMTHFLPTSSTVGGRREHSSKGVQTLGASWRGPSGMRRGAQCRKQKSSLSRCRRALGMPVGYRVSTETDGSFRFRYMPPGRTTLHATAPGHGREKLDILLADRARSLEIRLERTHVIVRVVDDATGTPIVGAGAILRTRDGLRRRGLGVLRTDDHLLSLGRLSFELFGGDPAELIVVAPGYKTQRVALPGTDGAPPRLDARMARGEDEPCLSGRVVGAKAVFVEVRATPFPPSPLQDEEAPVLSRQDTAAASPLRAFPPGGSSSVSACKEPWCRSFRSRSRRMTW